MPSTSIRDPENHFCLIHSQSHIKSIKKISHTVNKMKSIVYFFLLLYESLLVVLTLYLMGWKSTGKFNRTIFIKAYIISVICCYSTKNIRIEITYLDYRIEKKGNVSKYTM